MVDVKDENQNAVKNEESVHTAGVGLPKSAKHAVQDAVYDAAAAGEEGPMSATQDILEHLIGSGN